VEREAQEGQDLGRALLRILMFIERNDQQVLSGRDHIGAHPLRGLWKVNMLLHFTSCGVMLPLPSKFRFNMALP